MIAIIPAKSRSERLPGKNMKLLAGKPMVQWTIEAAINSGVFEQVCVSTNSEETKQLTNSLGAKYWYRSDDFADNKTTVFDVCKIHITINKDYCKKHDSFAVLLPTSPLRTSQDIKIASHLFAEYGADCLMSVTEYEHPVAWALRVNNEGHLFPIDDYAIQLKRQEFPKEYRHDGSIIMCKTQAFLEATDWFDMEVAPMFIPNSRAIDVNTQADFDYAEFLIGKAVESEVV